MRLTHLLHVELLESFEPILSECEDFLTLSEGLPLLKNLPSSYDDIHKVKVRKRKKQNDFTKRFNEAFDDVFTELRQRAVFANGALSLKESYNDEEPFFIFPIDGFKYLFSTEVENSNQQYQTVFEAILQELDENTAEQTLKDLLKFTYQSSNLAEGISSGAEIILYNIPYYYAVRTTSVPSYDDLLSGLLGE
jgi:hypothetical protein